MQYNQDQETRRPASIALALYPCLQGSKVPSINRYSFGIIELDDEGLIIDHVNKCQLAPTWSLLVAFERV